MARPRRALRSTVGSLRYRKGVREHFGDRKCSLTPFLRQRCVRISTCAHAGSADESLSNCRVVDLCTIRTNLSGSRLEVVPENHIAATYPEGCGRRYQAGIARHRVAEVDADTSGCAAAATAGA